MNFAFIGINKKLYTFLFALITKKNTSLQKIVEEIVNNLWVFWLDNANDSSPC